MEAGIRSAREEIGIERDDHVGLVERVLNVQAVCEEGAGQRGIVLHQLRLGIRLLHSLPLPRQRGRSDCCAQKVDAGSILGRNCLGAEDLSKLLPFASLAAIGRVLWAVGIIEGEEGSLRIRVRGAHVVGVFGIAVELDGAELIAFDQQRNRAGGEGMGGGKVHRLAEDEILRRLDVGINRLVGLLGATGQSGEGHGCAHELEEAAARDGIDPLLGRAGKLFLDGCLKVRRIGQLVERAPEALALYGFQILANGIQSHGREGRTRLMRGFGRARCLLVHGIPHCVSHRFCGPVFSISAHRWHTSQLVRSLGVRIL